MSDFPFMVGERVSQIYFEEVTNVEFEQVEVLTDTQRGENGCGSTGKN
jgi:dUTPase